MKDYRSAQPRLRDQLSGHSTAACERLGNRELKKEIGIPPSLNTRVPLPSAEGKKTAMSAQGDSPKTRNVWRMATVSDEKGLGAYMLRTFDDVRKSRQYETQKNVDAREPSEFKLRKAPSTPFPLQKSKGQILIFDFWTTWSAPAVALDPLFAACGHGNPTACRT